MIINSLTIAALLLTTFPAIVSFTPSRIYGSFFKNIRIYQHTDTTSEPISPAVYVSDLYHALGVPRNASRDELRNAYWKIAAKTHPDRNNSVEALEVYRNASYAYNILGKDENRRRVYDAERTTNDYMEALENLGTATSDLLVPLTFEVAVPLINATAQMIGSIAMPIIKDAFEQSNAVIKAASKKENQIKFDPFRKAAVAFERNRIEQQYYKQIELLRNHETNLLETSKELNAIISEEAKIEHAMQAIDYNITEVDKKLCALNINITVGSANLSRLNRRDVALKSSLSDLEYSIDSLMKSSNEINEIVRARKEEIIRLETLLFAQKQQLQVDELKRKNIAEEVNSMQSVINEVIFERSRMKKESENFTREKMSLNRELIETESIMESYMASLQSLKRKLADKRKARTDAELKLTKLRSQTESLQMEWENINKKKIESDYQQL